jgi:hypothetical protein
MKTKFLASETRQKIAYSLSCGNGMDNFTSSGWGERAIALLLRHFLPPLMGLVLVGCGNPRLAPWAILFRRSAAGSSHLKATSLLLGLLINFNVPVLKNGIQRVVYTNNNSASWRSSRLGG